MDLPIASDPSLPVERKAEVAVVGGGPAGLRAAETLAEGGCRVVLYEGKASVGRKFLVAGKGGLNLTHSEALERFAARYGEKERGRWDRLLAEFGPAELRAWAKKLGVETYVGTSGRVFPAGQQAAVLLRRWVARLRALGVDFHVNQRLEGATLTEGGWELRLQDTRNKKVQTPVFRAVVLALGGASWPSTGSDGKWTEFVCTLGVPVAPWHAANCGFEVDWSPEFLQAAEGLPIKNIAVTAGGRTIAGELLVTRYGLEGGALYQLGPELRASNPPQLWIDLKPSVTKERLGAQLWLGLKPGATVERVLAKAMESWKLSSAAGALLRFHRPDGEQSWQELVDRVKRFPVTLKGPRPVEEAISSAGGVRWEALDEQLGVTSCPGLFVAGEMVDWEAPTGGYLLQGCFATGTRAGRSAGRFLSRGV